MTAADLISLEWMEEVRNRANADAQFNGAARWLDSWIQLIVGEQKFSIKIFMGEIIRVLPGSVPFGHSFTLRGSEETWLSLLTADKQRLRELMAKGLIAVEGNVFESMRSTKAVTLLIEAARQVSSLKTGQE